MIMTRIVSIYDHFFALYFFMTFITVLFDKKYKYLFAPVTDWLYFCSNHNWIIFLPAIFIVPISTLFHLSSSN